MSTTEIPTPEEVRAPRGARLLEILWSDGSETRHPHRVLRGLCPCAHCQGHQGPIVWVEATDTLGDAGLELVSLEEVGSYGLRLDWGDGHTTGIYAFRYLRQLGALADADDAALRAARFGR